MITPYKQAYIVTLKSGRVVLAVIEATNRALGERAAKEAAIAVEPVAEFWAIAAYPTSPELPLQVTTLAAANDMLAALKGSESDLMAYVDRLYKDGPRMAGSLGQARIRLENVRHAIAKAEGRANG